MLIKTTIETICETLSKASTLRDVKIISEFPSQKQDMPLNNTMISVGLERVEVTGVEPELAIYADSSKTYFDFGLVILVPKSKTGTHCHEMVDKVLQALQPMTKPFNIVSVTSGEVKYSSSLAALTVPITVRIFGGDIFSQ